MPVYSFYNKDTEEEFEIEMPYSELDKYIADNPNLQQTFRMNLVDPIGIGVTKPPSDFQKFVLGKVAKVPGADKSKLEKRWHIPKEI